tara:strand:+ start:263 stop:505 length:243 start_codon:yes stop_codon:yes gene_type:complete
MKRNEWIRIGRKLTKLANNKNNSVLYPFDDKEKELIKEMILIINGVIKYDDENDVETIREFRGQEANSTNLFSFQRNNEI